MPRGVPNAPRRSVEEQAVELATAFRDHAAAQRAERRAEEAIAAKAWDEGFAAGLNRTQLLTNPYRGA